jgi:hypothetical protein
MNIDSNYLLHLIEQHGVLEALNKIDIELIDDLSVKTIVRTLLFSVECLMEELEEI